MPLKHVTHYLTLENFLNNYPPKKSSEMNPNKPKKCLYCGKTFADLFLYEFHRVVQNMPSSEGIYRKKIVCLRDKKLRELGLIELEGIYHSADKLKLTDILKNDEQ